ncbi:AAA family ATPase [Nocardia sp. NRRL S-836]|uniref:nSTAND1 domain-containing NTPase n=1 Tax=Nocardia sp. NRRL S-836 TaxID=1519492 RepID=UPI0006AFF433|nr:AAA family ATPase [Nocardia sp. NRRL S-836]
MTDRHIEIFPLALGHYGDPGLPPLDGVDAEVSTLAQLLADFGGVVTDWSVPMRDRGSDAVESRLALWSGSEHPFSMLYWAGHASANRAEPRLQHARSNERENRPGISSDRIAAAIAPRSRDESEHWHIVVIDTCWSAAFVQKVSAAIDAMPGDRQFLLIGTSGDGATNLGRFTAALRYVLRHNFGASDRISLWDLAGELRRTLPRAEVIPKKITDDAALHRTTPLTGAPLDVIDEINAVLADLSADERGHFIPKAQGGELGELSWYFQGRRSECERITAWLASHDHGLLVVTGAAGSGKSALLGYLLAQTRPKLRSVLTRHSLITELTPEQRPPENTFAAVMHLTGLSTQDALAHITAELGLDNPDSGASLTERIDRLLADVARRAPLTVLADALDEAVDPLTIANALLRRLAALDGVRVVVGTRRDTSEGPDQPPSERRNLLDALRVNDIIALTRDATAIGRYVASRLAKAFGDVEAVNDTAIAVGVSAHEFLFAHLAVHEILALGTLPTGPALDDLLATDHRGLFRRAVTRLRHAHPASTPVLRALAHAQGRGLPVRDGICALAATALAARNISDADVHVVLDAAAPYVLIDTEHSQSVLRLAHRTFVEHFVADGHQAIAEAMTDHVAKTFGRSANPYLAHYLSGHVGSAGEQAWILLDRNPDVLDCLDPTSVAADAWRTAFGRHPLPPAVLGVIGASHHLTTAANVDRPGLRQLAMSRHTTLHNFRPQEPPPHNRHAWHVHWAALTPVPTHRTLIGHTSGVATVAAVPLPDGRTLLATGSNDETVRLWDPTTGQPVGDPFTGHTDSVVAVTAVPLPHGRTRLATGSDDWTVGLWDPITGRPVGEALTGHTGSVNAVAAVPLPDGRTLLATGSDDATVRLWDPVTGQPVGDPLTGHTGSVNAVAAVPLPDGRTLLAVGSEDWTGRLWDVATRQPVGGSLTGHTGWITAAAAIPLPDGRTLLATSSRDKTVRLWDPETGQPVGEPLTGHTDWVAAVTAVPLPDGRTLLATGSHDKTVRLWDPETGQPVGEPLTGHTDWVVSVAAVPLPDGRTLLATGSDDWTVRLWDPTTPRPAGEPLTSHTDWVEALAAVPLSEGRPLLATSSHDKTVRLWNPETGQPVGEPLTGHTDWVVSVTAVPLPDGRTLLATGSNDETARLWDPETGQPVGEPLTGHTEPVRAVTAIPLLDHVMLLATGSEDGTVRFWDPTTRQLVGGPIACHIGGIMTMATIPLSDGRTLLATGSDDRTARLWDPLTGQPVGAPLTGHTDIVRAMAAIPLSDGHALLATGSHDQTARLWDPLTGQPVGAPLTGHTDIVVAVASMPLADNRIVVVTGSHDGTVRLWDPTTQAELKTIVVETPVLAIGAWHQDMIVVALSDGVAAVSVGIV